METPKQEKTLHVAVVDPNRRQVLVERRERGWIAGPVTESKETGLRTSEISRAVEFHMPSQLLPDKMSPERCANQLTQTQFNMPTAAFAGLRPEGNHYGYVVRPVSLKGITTSAPGFELHTVESLQQDRDSVVGNHHVYEFALQALQRTLSRRY